MQLDNEQQMKTNLENTSAEKNFEQTSQTTSTTNTDSQEDGPIVMRVKKRDGQLEAVNVNKIVNVVLACSGGLKEVDPMRVAAKVISGLYDGASTKELDHHQ